MSDISIQIWNIDSFKIKIMTTLFFTHKSYIQTTIDNVFVELRTSK